MKNLLATFAFLLIVFFSVPIPANAVGGIAFDSETENVVGTSVTSLTFSHTNTGSNLALVVGVAVNSATDVLTGVTYNGVAMTRINATQYSTTAWEYLYAMVAPTTGANNVVVSLSVANPVWAHAVSYTGVSQTGLPDAQTTNNATTGTSITTSITTVANNAWIVTYARNFAASVTAGTNFVLRSTAFPIAIGDTNAAITPAGATSVTANDGSSGAWTINILSLAPAPAVSLTSILTSWITWIF